MTDGTRVFTRERSFSHMPPHWAGPALALPSAAASARAQAGTSGILGSPPCQGQAQGTRTQTLTCAALGGQAPPPPPPSSPVWLLKSRGTAHARCSVSAPLTGVFQTERERVSSEAAPSQPLREQLLGRGGR